MSSRIAFVIFAAIAMSAAPTFARADLTVVTSITTSEPASADHAAPEIPASVTSYFRGSLARVETGEGRPILIYDGARSTVLSIDEARRTYTEQSFDTFRRLSAALPGSGDSRMTGTADLKFDTVKAADSASASDANRVLFKGFVTFGLAKLSKTGDDFDDQLAERAAPPQNLNGLAIEIPRYEIEGAYWRDQAVKLPGGRRTVSLAAAFPLCVGCEPLLGPVADRIAADRLLPVKSEITLMIGVVSDTGQPTRPQVRHIFTQATRIDRSPLPDTLFEAPKGFMRLDAPASGQRDGRRGGEGE